MMWNPFQAIRTTSLGHGAHVCVSRPLPICISRLPTIPTLVRPFLNEGWLVGGGAKFLTCQQDEAPRDWDVLIPAHRWGEIQHLLPSEGYRQIGALGGVILNDGIIKLDLWAGDIDTYMARLTRNEDTQTAIRLPLELVLVRAAHGRVGNSDGSQP